MKAASIEGRGPERRDASLAHDEIARAIGRIRFGSVVVQIQDGVVVQIEATEKRRFAPPASVQPARK